MQALLIDTDPGHDDAVALMLAFRWAEVLGITTVSGNAPLAQTTRNALALRELLGWQVPVVSGAARPLAGPTHHATHVHGESGLGGARLPPPQRPPDGDDAPGFIIDTARARDGLWVLAIGPLTNVALALEAAPDLTRRLGGIAVMGGSTGAGNATPVAEFNVWADPEAARIVLRSGVPVRLCGLNLTRQLQVDDPWLDALAAAAAGEAGGSAPTGGRGAAPALVVQMYRFLLERMERLTGARRATLHDPCALLAVTHPELLRFEPRAVDVELSGELTRGMTVVDERPSARAGAAPVQVAREIDARAAARLIAETLQCL